MKMSMKQLQSLIKESVRQVLKEVKYRADDDNPHVEPDIDDDSNISRKHKKPSTAKTAGVKLTGEQLIKMYAERWGLGYAPPNDEDEDEDEDVGPCGVAFLNVWRGDPIFFLEESDGEFYESWSDATSSVSFHDIVKNINHGKYPLGTDPSDSEQIDILRDLTNPNSSIKI